MTVLIGLEVDRTQSSLCVVEGHWPGKKPAFRVRLLQRLPRRTRYVKVADRLAEVVEALKPKSKRPRIYLNATKVGEPITALIREQSDASWLQPVYMTGGLQEPTYAPDRTITYGKAWLVSTLQALLEEGRLQLPPREKEATILVQELLDYEPHSPRGDEEGLFRVGTRDDLVNALAMVLHRDPPRPSSGRRLRPVARSPLSRLLGPPTPPGALGRL